MIALRAINFIMFFDLTCVRLKTWIVYFDLLLGTTSQAMLNGWAWFDSFAEVFRTTDIHTTCWLTRLGRYCDHLLHACLTQQHTAYISSMCAAYGSFGISHSLSACTNSYLPTFMHHCITNHYGIANASTHRCGILGIQLEHWVVRWSEE